ARATLESHRAVSRIRSHFISYEGDPLLAVADRGFFFRNAQLEGVLDEPPHLLLDSFCICIGADETADQIISRAAVVEPFVSAVERVATGQAVGPGTRNWQLWRPEGG